MKKMIKELLFLLGTALCVWPLIIFIGGDFSFMGETANKLSFGILKLQMFEGNEELSVVLFIAIFVFGGYVMYSNKR
jgi:hypothetical protein